MAALSRGQENTTAIINWFITINGSLNDAFLVEYRIMDISGGLPGTQVFPLPDGTYEDVTLAPGRFATGSYYAYDNTGVEGWTPDLAATVGTHRIEWRWQISSGAPLQTGFEDFEVLVQSAGSSADLYIQISDIRDKGITEAMADDDAVTASIELWQQFLERATRQFFTAKTMVLLADGTDSDALHFGIPIISISSLKLNGDTTALDTSLYRVYNGITYPDDRRNPRIKLTRENRRNIYVSTYGNRKFLKGRQNQEISGTFGFVEEGGATPKLIQHALCKLVVEKLTHPVYPDPANPIVPSPPLLGNLLEEETDDHRQKYEAPGGPLSTRQPGLVGITNDQEILDIIRLYRSPIGIGSPAHYNLG